MADRRIREAERDASMDGLSTEVVAKRLAEYIRSGLLPERQVQAAVVAGDEASRIIYPNYHEDIDSVESWLQRMVDIGGDYVRVLEAVVILRELLRREATGEFAEAAEEEWAPQMEYLQAVVDNPTEEHAQKFIDSVRPVLGEVQDDTIDGIPTSRTAPSYLFLLHNIVYPLTNNTNKDYARFQNLHMLISLALNEDYGAGMSETELQDAVRKELIPLLLRPRD